MEHEKGERVWKNELGESDRLHSDKPVVYN